jgi:hypothetical protein
LQNGAQPDSTDAEGRTPLHAAMESIDHEVHTDMLVKFGANVKVRDNNGRTPLCHFIQKICHSLAEIQQGSKKPLLSAYDNVASLERTLDTLLDAGSEPMEADNDKKSATDYAIEVGLEWAIRKLSNGMPRLKSPIVSISAVDPDSPGNDKPSVQRRATELASNAWKKSGITTKGITPKGIASKGITSKWTRGKA